MERVKDSCLICLQRKENDFDQIFSLSHNNSKCKSELALMYEDVFNLDINENLGLPQYLCPYCALQLKLLSKFKKKALDSYNIIQKACNIKKFTNVENNVEKQSSNIINKNFTIFENNHNDEEEIITTTSISPAPDSVMPDDNLEIVVQEINYDDFNSNNMKINDNDFFEVQFLDNDSIRDDIDDVTIELEQNDEDDDQIYDDVTILSNISSPFKDDEEEEEICKEYEIENLTNNNKSPEKKPRKYTNKNNKKFQCSDCKITFFQRLHLVEHKKEKHPRHSCEICSKRFLSLDGYNSHMKIHMGLPAYKCNKCDKPFNQKQHLIYHSKHHHSNERNFECILCSKKFVAKGDLKIHMRVHNDERRYECDICKKRFRAHTHMTNHRYSHFEKCMECPHCHLKYASPSSLKIHIQSVHDGLCPHECKICHKKFKRRHHLLSHFKTHTKSKGETKEDIIIDGYVQYDDTVDVPTD